MIIKNPVTETINFGTLVLNVQIERTKRKKTVSLQVKDKKLIIKAPKVVSKESLNELIQRKQNWIRERATMNFEEQNLRNREFIDNEKFVFRGKEYALSVIAGREETVKIGAGLLVVTIIDDKLANREAIKTLLEAWYLRESIKFSI